VGTLAQEYDCLLLDLDGTVFRGHELTEGAAASLEKVPGRMLFVTNNASRSADEVASHLHDIGLNATADDVVTSAQSAARVLAAQFACRRGRGSRPAAGTAMARQTGCRGPRSFP
jgi:glycerol 3-phosphatase-2